MKKLKKMLFVFTATLMLFSAMTVVADASEPFIAHDGYLVIECTASVVPAEIDNVSYCRSAVVIVASSIARQQETLPTGTQRFRAHGHIRGYSNDWEIGASAQMWNAANNRRLNRAQPTWEPNGHEAWSTSPWTLEAGVARIFAQSNPNFW